MALTIIGKIDLKSSTQNPQFYKKSIPVYNTPYCACCSRGGGNCGDPFEDELVGYINIDINGVETYTHEDGEPYSYNWRDIIEKRSSYHL